MAVDSPFIVPALKYHLATGSNTYVHIRYKESLASRQEEPRKQWTRGLPPAGCAARRCLGRELNPCWPKYGNTDRNFLRKYGIRKYAREKLHRFWYILIWYMDGLYRIRCWSGQIFLFLVFFC